MMQQIQLGHQQYREQAAVRLNGVAGTSCNELLNGSNRASLLHAFTGGSEFWPTFMPNNRQLPKF